MDLEELRQQDFDAFAALVAGHQSVVLGLCRSMGLHGADIEDTAADVFANVFRSLPTFDGRAKLGTLLVVAVVITVQRALSWEQVSLAGWGAGDFL